MIGIYKTHSIDTDKKNITNALDMMRHFQIIVLLEAIWGHLLGYYYIDTVGIYLDYYIKNINTHLWNIVSIQ